MLVMMLQLALVFLTGCSSAIGSVDAAIEMKVGVALDHSPYYVPHAGTSNTIWVKHGDNLAFSVGSSYTWWGAQMFRPFQDISVYQDTWVWTTGSDALLVDYFRLYAHDGVRQWGAEDSHGWCLSTDHWDDAAEFNWENWGPEGNVHVVPDWRCYSLVELNRNGLIYYYWDDDWRPNHDGPAHDRRALMEEAGIPSVEDVQACEEDPATDTNQDCGPMVDEIINFELEHWTKREAVYQDGDEEDAPDNDVGNTDTETATDDRRALSAVKRLLKA